MPSEPDNRDVPPRRWASRPRWWNTLAFRLAAAVNVTVIAVLALSAWVDHRRDTAMQIQYVLTRLQEEARVLRAAWNQFGDAGGFQRVVDNFCHQMTVAASPGHHIAVFDSHDTVIARAHERADPELERLMRDRLVNETRTFDYAGERFASVSLNIGNGSRIAVAVSLRPVEEVLRAQGISRAVTMAILVVVLFGLTALCLLIWVRDPLRGFVRAVSAAGKHQFDHRVVPRGAGDLRLLANGLNEMIDALGRSQRERASEMQRAREIQRALTASPSAAIRGLETRAVFLPADSVGGDLLDIVSSGDGSVLVAMIDVTGHGVPGALCTALLRSAVRHMARATDDLVEIMQGLNRELCDIAAAGLFATALLVKLRPDDEKIEYVSAGHDPPVRVDADGTVETLNHAGLLLGVDPRASYAASEAELPPDGRLFMFTDGLHEAMAQDGEQFGRKRLTELFASTAQLSLDTQLPAVVSEVRSFQGRDGFDDDVTVFAVRRTRVAGGLGTSLRHDVRHRGAVVPCPATME